MTSLSNHHLSGAFGLYAELLDLHGQDERLSDLLLLASYLYNNVLGELEYFVSPNDKRPKKVKLDSVDCLKMRNACFWGVASGN